MLIIATAFEQQRVTGIIVFELELLQYYPRPVMGDPPARSENDACHWILSASRDRTLGYTGVSIY